MSSVSQNNKRIAQNTIMLYIRMLVITLISLYTVRLTLAILGTDDYGIYNAVAGVIGFVGFISATLANSAQRYLAFYLGKDDKTKYCQTFSILLIVFVAISLFIVVIAEILGPWLIESYLIIPEGRLCSAQWVFQISLISLFIRLIVTPYTASIIAYEKMGVYAYLSIAEAVFKLLVIYALTVISYDKLIVYAVLYLLMDIVISSFNVLYCIKQFPNCRFRWFWDKICFKEIGGYIGWNTFGSLSGSLQSQAITMATSAFFQPSVLAARAIAEKVNNVSYSFVSNFILASSPQMVKYYAAGDGTNFNYLFYRISKFSYYLMLIIAVPLIITMPDVLSLWLSESLLDEMVIFSRLALLGTLFSSLETPISRAIAATGNVRLYQIMNCAVAFLSLLVVIIVFRFGFSAEWAYIIPIAILAFSLVYRLAILKKYSPISYGDYINRVVLPVAVVSIAGIIIFLLVTRINISGTISRAVGQGFVSLICIAVVVYLSLGKEEKRYINNMIIGRLKKN